MAENNKIVRGGEGEKQQVDFSILTPLTWYFLLCVLSDRACYFSKEAGSAQNIQLVPAHTEFLFKHVQLLLTAWRLMGGVRIEIFVFEKKKERPQFI